MKQPLVSIIIPAFNSGRFIAEAISSALAQTWPNKELIIVDDGSADDSLAIAKSFESANVRVFHQENKGASAARNRGLAEAKGDFIQYLDADDLLSADKIELQVNALLSNPGKVAACGTVHFKNGANHHKGRPTRYEESFLFDDNDPVHFFINLLGGYTERGSMISVHSWLTPRSIIEKAGAWNEALTTDDDGEFFCRVLLNSNGVVKTKGISYYRKYDDENKSLSSQRNKNAIESVLRSVLLKKEHLFARNTSNEAKLAIYKQLLSLAQNAYPVYPKLYRQIDTELKKLPKFKIVPVLGGKYLNFTARYFGWQTAKRLQHLYNKLFKT